MEWHVRFTKISLKCLCDQEFRRYSDLRSGKLSARKPRECTLARSVQCTLARSVHFTLARSVQCTLTRSVHCNLNCFPVKGLKGTVVNWTFLSINRRSLEITLTWTERREKDRFYKG